MVLSQIRFPMEVIGLKPANSAAVDGAMSAAGFPMVRSDVGITLDAGANGAIQFQGNPDSRVYFTADLAYAVMVSPRFISIYCVDRGEGIPYAGHEAFLSREGGTAALGSDVPAEGVHVVSGTLAPRTMIDPAIPPAPEPRWIVDIDSYSLSATTFSDDAIREKARTLAGAGRGLFYNHVVNESFTARFK